MSDTAELRTMLAELTKDRERINGWESLTVIDNGKTAKFLKSELWHKKNIANDEYRKIDTMNTDKVSVSQRLMAIQIEQKVYDDLLYSMSNVQILKNMLDKDIEACSKLLASEESVTEPLRQPV